MKRIALIAWLAVMGLVARSHQAIAAQKPHVVVFISDDLGRESTSIHGSPDAKTPAMDRLAAAGMAFDNAYVASPSCCPNRFSFLTGLMPARHGAHPNHSQPKRGTKYLPPLFKAMGYKVLSFGKIAHGRNGFPGCDFVSTPREGMSTHIKAYFAKHKNTSKLEGPICLMVGDRRPHVTWSKLTDDSPYAPKTITLPPYLIDTPETREHWARYLTDITSMDAEMGRVYDFAKKQFGDNFIFLFTSDHGGQWPFGKWNLYDAGTRIPLVVVWPGKIKPKTRSQAFVSWVDLLPTLLDLTGGKPHAGIDGRSFAPVLLGQAETHRDKVFTTHTGDGKMNIFPIRSVRVGPWKYIHNLRPNAYHTNHSNFLRRDGGGAFWHSWDAAAKKDSEAARIIKAYYTRPEFELFDLSSDPLEQNNLANKPQQQERLQAMRAALAAWTKAQGDDLQPHAKPYPKTEPLPKITAKPKRKKKPKGSKAAK